MKYKMVSSKRALHILGFFVSSYYPIKTPAGNKLYGAKHTTTWCN